MQGFAFREMGAGCVFPNREARPVFFRLALMNPRICICCGELISGKGETLSRNPNLCPSCSSLADGMDEPSIANLEPEVSGRKSVIRDQKPVPTSDL